MMKMGQARRGVVDETCCEWMIFKARRCATSPNHVLSHTNVRVKSQRCKQVRDTDKTEKMCVRRGFLSSLPSRARHSLLSVREKSGKKYMALKESVAITLSTSGDLVIERLGVRVATIVVRMMKRKVATSRFSNYRMVFAVLSRSSELRNSVVLVLVEDL